jgi:hypothetical protein
MMRDDQLAPRGGARRQPYVSIGTASTAAERLQALYPPLEEAKV